MVCGACRSLVRQRLSKHLPTAATFQGKLEEYIRRKYQYREFVDPNRNAPLTAADEAPAVMRAAAPVMRAAAPAAAAPSFDLLGMMDMAVPAPVPAAPAAASDGWADFGGMHMEVPSPVPSAAAPAAFADFDNAVPAVAASSASLLLHPFPT